MQNTTPLSSHQSTFDPTERSLVAVIENLTTHASPVSALKLLKSKEFAEEPNSPEDEASSDLKASSNDPVMTTSSLGLDDIMGDADDILAASLKAAMSTSSVPARNEIPGDKTFKSLPKEITVLHLAAALGFTKYATETSLVFNYFRPLFFLLSPGSLVPCYIWWPRSRSLI